MNGKLYMLADLFIELNKEDRFYFDYKFSEEKQVIMVEIIVYGVPFTLGYSFFWGEGQLYPKLAKKV